MALSNEWKQTNIRAFWNEIAPCHHLVQIYENERVFLETLEGFAGNGLLSGETVVVIGTSTHLSELNDRLTKQGFDLEMLIGDQQYMPLDAAEILNKLLAADHPDEDFFQTFIAELLQVTAHKKRKLKVFGEMVFLLWKQGNRTAALELEQMWNGILEKHDVCIYCAYPKWLLNDQDGKHLMDVCASHTTLIGGWPKPSTEIYYKMARPN